jgi:hypothetical protein
MPYMAEAEYHNIVCLSFKSLCLSSIMLFVQSALLLWKPFRYISDNAIEKKKRSLLLIALDKTLQTKHLV